MRKIFSLLLFMFCFNVSANSLLDAIRRGQVTDVKFFLNLGDPIYYPDVLDSNNQTAYDALKDCPEDKRAEIRALIDQYCTLRGVTIKTGHYIHYANDLDDRRSPKNKADNLGMAPHKNSKNILNIFIANGAILELFKPDDRKEAIEVGPNNFIIPVIDGKNCLQQKFLLSGSLGAAILMRQADLKVELSSSFYVSHSGDEFDDLARSQFIEKNININNLSYNNNMVNINGDNISITDYLSNNLPINGPAIISIYLNRYSKDLKHWLIIDNISINDSYVDLRDPFHGWCIRIGLDMFSLLLKQSRVHSGEIIWTNRHLNSPDGLKNIIIELMNLCDQLIENLGNEAHDEDRGFENKKKKTE